MWRNVLESHQIRFDVLAGVLDNGSMALPFPPLRSSVTGNVTSGAWWGSFESSDSYHSRNPNTKVKHLGSGFLDSCPRVTANFAAQGIELLGIQQYRQGVSGL